MSGTLLEYRIIKEKRTAKISRTKRRQDKGKRKEIVRNGKQASTPREKQDLLLQLNTSMSFTSGTAIRHPTSQNC